VSELLETLAAELERPRELSAQVAKHLVRTYDIDHDAVGPFLDGELPRLEDYEHDLILSPLFTPRLADQAVFAELLGSDSVPREQWPALIQQLAARPTRVQLVTSDGQAHSVTLREVTLERYVYRLRLDGAIPESLFKRIDQVPSAADRPMLKAVARRAVWENDVRRNILAHYLTAAAGSGAYGLADAVGLLKLVEDYKPADVAGLLARIPVLQQSLRHEINTGYGPKPFFSQRVEQDHGGDRDQRRQDDVRMSAKENELAFLDRLQHALEG
jgi:hypothetical protein